MRRAFIYLNILFALPGAAAVNVPLTVREALYPGSTSGIGRTDEPLTVGVPLADSAGVSSTNVLGLSGASAAQFVVEGRWPSGNIKWVKVRATLPSIPAGGTTTVTLTNTGSGNFGGANLATDNGATITVSTGAASFTIRKANFNVVDQVVVGTKTLVTSGSSQGLVLTGPDPGAAYPANVTCLPTTGGSACSTAYTSANDPNSTAVIEENGPAMAVIKATGDHVDSAGHVYTHFTARLYFYRNRSYLKVTSILRNADYGKSNTFATAYKGFQGYELRVAPNFSGTLNYRIANHTSSATAGTLDTAGTDSVYIYQAESTLMKPSSWCSGSGCVPYSSLSGYSIVKNGTAVTSGSGSQYPTGWADISDSSGAGIEIGQYQFAAYGNKSLEFNAGGKDARIGIWARENNTTSTSSSAANAPYYMPWPQWSINDVYVNFHAASNPNAGDEFLKFQHYLVASAATSYYNSCGVFMYPLLDAAEEDSYYASVVSSASPAISAPSLSDLGTADAYNWPLNAWRFYAWPAGGVSNQMEFRLAHLQNFIRRGLTGNYLDSAHFYKLIAEQAFPLSDGFDWRTAPAGETQYIGLPTAASANSGRGMRDWVQADHEHSHWYGMPDYYFMSGDETIHDGIVEGPKDSFMNASSNGGGTTSEVAGGWFWNARAVGVVLMSDARLYSFLQATGDPDAGTLATNGQTVYRLQIQPDFCAYAGYPAGCTPDPLNNIAGYNSRQRGVSRVRGVPYQWGDTIKSGGCPGYPNDVRDQATFMVGILLEGLWEFRQAMGPGWANYNEAFDLGYGVARWAFGEMYSDDNTNSWTKNGFRYKLAIDAANACNVGAGGSANDFYFMVQNPNAFWPIFYFRNQYEGDGTAAGLKRQFNQELQQVISIGPSVRDELYQYTIAQVIYALNHPAGVSLNTVPVTGFTDNGGGSYTITWNVPTGAASYRIKWGSKKIVDWIGFDAGSYSFIGDPASTMNWFAATDAANVPSPAGTTQSLTINTGTSGLTSANFMVKAYTGGGAVPPPPDTTPPVVSLTAPAAGATVSGSIAVAATASDNVAVSSLQFRLDGVSLGAPIAGGGPYSISWDTTKASAGAHVLSAAATDAAGNTGVSSPVSVTVSNTSAAPVISNVTAGSISTSGATITWITDMAADSQVAYGTSALYGSTTPLTATLLTSHFISLSGLAASTTYHYQVISRNAQGTVSNSTDFTFTTAAASTGGGSTPPVKTWTKVVPYGPPAMTLGYDKTVYVSSRNLHCQRGSYHQYRISGSEPNDALVCYSYPENRWIVLQNSGAWHDGHTGQGGHTEGIFTYLPDKDAIIYQADGSGTLVPDELVGWWWLYDVGGMSGQNREMAARPWLGTGVPVGAMAYDTLRSKLVMFPDGNGITQVCDPNTNQCTAPNTTGTAPPTTVGNIGLAYNTSDHKVYAFINNNVYTFDAGTNTWTLLSPTCTGPHCVSGKPPGRQAAGWAYSTRDNIFLMAGGVAGSFGSGTTMTDTWVFDPVAVAWTEQASATPFTAENNRAVFDRLSYDEDSNVFVIMTATAPGPIYAEGTFNFYQTAVYVFPYSAPLGYGRTTTTYTPPPGSLNRVDPTTTDASICSSAGGKCQSWALSPAIAASGSNLYTGWVETGAQFDTSNCGVSHHPYIKMTPNSGTWTPLPGGTQAAACAAIDPENSSATDSGNVRIAVVNGTLWEVHEKSTTGNTNIPSTAWARFWTGSSWSGGQIGCFSGTCGGGTGGIQQYPAALIDSGGKPTVALIEESNLLYVREYYLRVAQWNAGTWTSLGGKLNINGTGSRVMFASLATDGTNPAACWSEEVVSSNRGGPLQTTPQIQCAQWNGSAWQRFGASSLNQSPSNYAYEPTVTYAQGHFYIAWTERTVSGNSKVYSCRWDGSSCSLLGAGALNVNNTTGWAAHPSLSTDGTNVYLGWEEQASMGQHSLGYVKKWDGTNWTALGGPIAADTTNGSIEGISLTVVQGIPTAIWGEVTYGNLRQIYVKQWNGSAWAGFSSSATPPAGQTSCDLNGDGKINSADVQSAIEQALGVAPCGAADLQGTGQCTVVGVQRVVNASMGGACITGQ